MGEKIKYYVLDISECSEEVKSLYDGVERFPMMSGQYCCEYDIIEELLPVDLCNKLRHETSQAKEHIEYVDRYYGERGVGHMDFMPLGLSTNELRPGAKITEVKPEVIWKP